MTEVEQQGRALAKANTRRQLVMTRLTTVVRAAAEQGTPETELARQAGVDRMTIRRMLGKL